MKVIVTPRTNTSHIELNITISPHELAPYITKAAQQLSQERPVAGFRPGKASVDVAIATFGAERVLQTAIGKAIPHFFVEAILENNLEAINRPSIALHELGLDKPLRFTAVVDVLPDVHLGDVTAITAQRKTVTVQDQEVEQELAYLAKMRSTYLAVARPAQWGDTVLVDFTINIEGKLLQDGESKNHPVHLGEGHFLPDFEKQLLGITAGQERTFVVTFPDTVSREELRGKQASVWVKTHAIQKRIIPQLNDEFAQHVGKFTSLAHLQDELTKNLILENERKEEERFRAELSEALAHHTTFGPLPSILVEKEIDRRLEELRQMLSLHHKTVDDYLTQHKKTPQQMRDDMRATAEQAVKVALTLRAFAAREGITVDAEEVETKTQEYLKRFSTVQEARATGDLHELREHIASVLRNQKTLERLEALVTRSNNQEKTS